MKKIFTLFAAALFSSALFAQEMPQPSPEATVMQRVGLTDVTVKYSRPGVKDRAIFGELVPYGELWRTGANGATNITFSTDVMFGGKAVKAGTYALFTIPNADEWTIILNTDTDLWGTGGYTEAHDVLRVTVKPMENQFVERFTISVDNMTDNTADVVLAWANTKVAIPISAETEKFAEKNMNKALADAARACRAAAEFHTKKQNYAEALKYIDQSIALNDNWYTNWLKADILAKSGDKKGAKKQAEHALEMGEKYYAERNQPFSYRANLEAEMAKW